MSADDLVRHPLKYIKSHIIQFSHLGRDVNGAASGMVERSRTQRQGWASVEFQKEPGQFTKFSFQGDNKPDWEKKINVHVRLGKAAVHSIKCEKSAVDFGVRFLPWEENAVTFLQLDAAAKSFFTGPLSGCSIFIVEDTRSGGLWAFHANRNAVTGGNNVAVKHAMMAMACFADAAIPGRIRHECLYRRDYADIGFVFGERSGARWKFWAASTEDAASGKIKEGVKSHASYKTHVKELPRVA